MILYNNFMATTLMIRNAMSVNLAQYPPKNNSRLKTLWNTMAPPIHFFFACWKLVFRNRYVSFNENITPLLVVLLIELNREDYRSWRTPVEFLSSIDPKSILKNGKIQIDKGFSCVYNCKILCVHIYIYSYIVRLQSFTNKMEIMANPKIM